MGALSWCTNFTPMNEDVCLKCILGSLTALAGGL
jgi:hypothetical protein